MTLRAKVLIPEPCPVAWDELTGTGEERFCARCQRSVHALSRLTEAELRRVVKRGESMCAQVLVDRDGAIVPLPPRIVPVSRLRAPALAATTLAVIVACTPHVRPDEPVPEPTPVLTSLPHLPIAPVPPRPPLRPDDVWALGGVVVSDPDEDVWGDLMEAQPHKTVARIAASSATSNTTP